MGIVYSLFFLKMPYESNWDSQKIIDVAASLTHKMTERAEIAKIISSVARVHPDNLKKFEAVAGSPLLVQGMTDEERSRTIRVVGEVSYRGDLSKFAKTIDALSLGMNARQKALVVQALSSVPLEKYEAFKDDVEKNTKDMDYQNKLIYIYVNSQIRYNQILANESFLFFADGAEELGRWRYAVGIYVVGMCHYG